MWTQKLKKEKSTLNYRQQRFHTNLTLPIIVFNLSFILSKKKIKKLQKGFVQKAASFKHLSPGGILQIPNETFYTVRPARMPKCAAAPEHQNDRPCD